MRHRLAAGLVCLVLLPSCRTWPAAPAGRSAPAAHESLDAVLWMQTSAEAWALSEQAFTVARVQLDEALRPGNAAWTAALEQDAGYEELPPAVVVDVDEAVLDTSPFQAELVRQGERFRPADWDAWVRREEARPLPGAVEFAGYTARRGVKLFFVTNRVHELEEPTLGNLRKVGFPVDADGANVLTLGEKPDWGSDKTTRRRFIARTHRIVLIVGDDLNDFVPGSHTAPAARVALAEEWQPYWGTRWIMIPNPFYGGWEQSLYDFQHGLPRPEVLRRKREALDALDAPAGDQGD